MSDSVDRAEEMRRTAIGTLRGAGLDEGSLSSQSSSDRLVAVDKLARKRRFHSYQDFQTFMRDEDFEELNGNFRFRQEDNKRRNPFIPTYHEGNIHWTACKPCNAEEVREVMEWTLNARRPLLVNTGTHGTPSGETVATNKACGEGTFIVEDVLSSKNNNFVAVHIVSSYSGPIFPEKLDVMLAWCYSEKSTPYRSVLPTASEEKQFVADVLQAAQVDSKFVDAFKEKGYEAKFGDISGNSGPTQVSSGANATMNNISVTGDYAERDVNKPSNGAYLNTGGSMTNNGVNSTVQGDQYNGGTQHVTNGPTITATGKGSTAAHTVGNITQTF